jgi:GntR family transcriptional regulator
MIICKALSSATGATGFVFAARRTPRALAGATVALLFYPVVLACNRSSHLYACTNTMFAGGPMQIHISSSDGVPIYLQIVNQVKYLVASGRLAAGAELPPIRVLAEKLLINPSTVARAYRELEMAGIVEKRRTAGTYVSDQGSPLARRERIKILAERIDALLAEARQMNIDVEEVLKLVEQRNRALQPTGRAE